MQRWSRNRKALRSQSSICNCSPNPSSWRRSLRCVRSTSTEASTKVSRRIIFSGIQPTGVPHLGNYLGAIRPWVQLQKEKTSKDVLNISIVDLHALTIPQDPGQLKKWRSETYIALLAVGLDPQISRIFYQSEVTGHTELMWILSTLASTGHLSRMTQWKSKLNLSEEASLQDSEARSSLKLGLFSYPVLQAADILLYKSTHVPVGEDQQQHIEFARTVAGSFNHAYGEIFPIPKPMISPAKRIMSLTDPTKKMSKSDPNPNSRILVTDDEGTIRRKLRTALTDSKEGISYDPENRPGVSSLLDILKHIRHEDMSSHDLAADFKNSSLRSLKEAVGDEVAQALRDVREKFMQLRSSASLQYETGLNRRQATVSAAETLREVKDAIGLLPSDQRLRGESKTLPVSE